MLLHSFKGQKLTTKEVYLRHSVRKPYIKRNYKQILAKMEAVGKITADPPADKRPKRKGQVTFADGVIVTFPKKGAE